MIFRDWAWRGLAAAACGLACLPAERAAAADFYAGRTIELEVGADVGGGYDIYARTLARHLGRHIPGNPTIVVKNMPGAGSGRTAVFISNVAPKDGATLGALMPGAIIGPLLDDKAETAIRSHQGDLYRLGRCRHPHLRDLPDLQDQDLRGRPQAEDHPGRHRRRRRHPRLRLSAQPHLRHQVRRRRRLQGHRRYHARHGARRGRRHLRLGLVERQIAEVGMGARQQAQHPGPGRARSQCGIDRHGGAASCGNSSATTRTARSPRWW